MQVYLENNADNLNAKAQADLQDAITSATDAGKGSNADAMWEALKAANASFAEVQESAAAYTALIAALDELDGVVGDYYETASAEAKAEYDKVSNIEYNEKVDRIAKRAVGLI